jgi:hypothetical protein
MATEERLAIFVERMMRSARRTAGRSRKEFWTLLGQAAIDGGLEVD